jgi:hypothetical protein
MTLSIIEVTFGYRQQKGRPKPSLFAMLLGDLQRLNVLCLPALGAFHHVKLNCLTLLEGAEALCLNGGVVNEDIFPALAADESETLGVVKPLHCSLFHIA